MGKIFSFVSVMAVAFTMTLSLVSCDNPTPPPTPNPNPNDTTNTGGGSTTNPGETKYDKATKLVTNYQFDYYGDPHKKNVNNYFIFFTTGDVVMEKNAQGSSLPKSGNGKMVCLEVNAATEKNLFPEEGLYPMSTMEEAGTVLAGKKQELSPTYIVYSGCLTQIVENGKVVDTHLAVDGSVKIKGNPAKASFYAEMTFADGKKETFFYEGSVKIADCSKK